jgi:uncharacterized protein YecT (DUF1311 family)
MKLHKINLWAIILLLVGCSNFSTSENISTQPPVAPSNLPASTEEIQEGLPSPSATNEFTQRPCEKLATTQNELNECARERAKLSRTKLVSLIDELASRLDETRQERLIEIETAWEKMIVEHCEWQASFFEGGSIQPMWFSECLNQQYLDRIEALRLNLCEGNGMTGECEESLKYKSNVP